MNKDLSDNLSLSLSLSQNLFILSLLISLYTLSPSFSLSLSHIHWAFVPTSHFTNQAFSLCSVIKPLAIFTLFLPKLWGCFFLIAWKFVYIAEHTHSKIDEWLTNLFWLKIYNQRCQVFQREFFGGYKNKLTWYFKIQTPANNLGDYSSLLFSVTVRIYGIIKQLQNLE